MKRFIDLNEEPVALEQALVRMGLILKGSKTNLVALTGGVSSNIFRIDLPSGSVCLKQALPQLKVQKEWLAPISRVFAEIDWLEVAHKIIPHHVPKIVAIDRECGAFVMEFVSSSETWKSKLLQGLVDMAFGTSVAECIAKVHQATARNKDIQQRFAHDGTFYLIRLEPYLIETARVNPDLARQLIGLVATTQSTPLALVHGDVSPKNILLHHDGPVLLDAECAWYGDPVFDLAFLLNHVLLKSAHLPIHGASFASLFESMVMTYLSMVNWEPREDFDHRCARLIPGLLLARVDGKSPVEYLDEDAQKVVRQEARLLILEPPQGLLDLHRRWLWGKARA